jgi:hypothetical protein
MSKQDYWAAVIRIGFVLIFYVGLSFAILLAVVLRRGFYVNERAYLSKMMEGTAWRPFVYRVLVPKTAFIAGKSIPFKDAVVQKVELFAKKHAWMLLGKQSYYRFEYLVVVLIMVFALTGSAIVWKQCLSYLYEYPPYLCYLLPVFGIIALAPILLLYGPYPYDPMTLLVFSLAIFALLTHNKRLYYPAFLLALLNKETSLLLPFLFGYSFASNTRRQTLLLEMAVQFGAWFAWRYYLIDLYRSNPGVNMEFHLFDYNLPFFTYFGLKHVRFALVIFGFIALVFYRWKDKPLALRRLLMVSCAFLLPLHVLFAWIDEFRGLLELYPVLFLLSASSVISALNETRSKTAANSGNLVHV